MGRTIRGKKGKGGLSPLEEEMLEILSPTSSNTQEEIPEYTVVEAVYVPPSESGNIPDEPTPPPEVIEETELERDIRACQSFLRKHNLAY